MLCDSLPVMIKISPKTWKKNVDSSFDLFESVYIKM